MATTFVPQPLSTGGVTLAGQQPAPIPAPMPQIDARRTVVNPNAPGAGRDAGIMRRSDPAEITGRIQQIFSNLGASLAKEGMSDQERLADLTRQVQAGRSFDDLRRSAGIIASTQGAPSLDSLQPATPTEYEIGPTPLSPELQRLIGQRRIDADMAYAQAEADRNYGVQAAGTRAALQMTDIDRWAETTDLANRQRLAARGVARSPMFANPAQRQVFEQANRAGGEVRFNLASTLTELDRALRAAATRRQAEYGEIEMDIGDGQSDVNAMLGVR